MERHQYYAEVFVNVGVIIAYQVRFDFFFVLFEIVFGEIQVINVERNGQYLGQQVVTPWFLISVVSPFTDMFVHLVEEDENVKV